MAGLLLFPLPIMAQPLVDEQSEAAFEDDEFEEDFSDDDSVDEFEDDNFEEDFLEAETELPCWLTQKRTH